MIRRPPRSTQSRSSAASDVYKRQTLLLNLLSLMSRVLLPTTVVIVTPFYTYPNPDVRTWLYLSQDNLPISWYSSGWPYKTISNAVGRLYAYDTRNMGILLSAGFPLSLIEETSITFQFKYLEVSGEINTLDPEELNDYYYSFGFVLSFWDCL